MEPWGHIAEALSRTVPLLRNHTAVSVAPSNQTRQGVVSRRVLIPARPKLVGSLPFEGATLRYRFEGKVSGGVMKGSLDLGEYPNATWEAKRHTYA